MDFLTPVVKFITDLIHRKDKKQERDKVEAIYKEQLNRCEQRALLKDKEIEKLQERIDGLKLECEKEAEKFRRRIRKLENSIK